MTARFVLLAVVLLWIAGGLQQAVAPRLTLLGTTPDFLLIVMVNLTLFSNRRGGAVLGLFAGWIRGALAGANLAVYVGTRVLTGFLLGWFTDLEIEGHPLLACFATVAATLLAQGLLVFAIHRGPLAPFLAGTLLVAAVNGVLAMPVYAGLRRALDPPVR